MTGATDISCEAQWSEFCSSAEMFTDKSFKRLAAIAHPVHSQPRQRPSKSFQDTSNITRFLGQSKIRRFAE